MALKALRIAAAGVQATTVSIELINSGKSVHDVIRHPLPRSRVALKALRIAAAGVQATTVSISVQNLLSGLINSGKSIHAIRCSPSVLSDKVSTEVTSHR